MTAKQIFQQLDSNVQMAVKFHRNFDAQPKLWDKGNIARIYFGTSYVQIKDGKVTYSGITPRQGFYESNMNYADRMDARQSNISLIQVIARYTQILLNK
jgi:hypothetical protein